MNKNKRGMKKLWPALLATILLTLVMICAVLPTGAYEMTSEMLRDLQGFFETHEDLELNSDALAAFVKDYLYEKNADDPEHFSDEDMAELEVLLTKDGEADYMILTGMLLGNGETPDVNAALDALEKVASAQQLIAFVKAQTAYGMGVEADTYPVIWQVNGVSVEDSYRHMDVYSYPSKAELGLVSGEFVRWNTGAFFEAPASKDKPVVITGTVSNLASELTEISDGITDVNQVFHAEIDEENRRVVLALDVHASNYMEVLSSLMDFSSNSALKAEIKAMMYDIAAAGINAGVNRLSVNGHDILTVDSYAITDLVDVLDRVAEGDVDGLVSVQGIEAFIKNENYTMYRFTHMTPVTVDGVTYQSFGDYRVNLATDGLESAEWTVSLAFDGDTSEIVQIAKWLEDAVTVTDIENGKNFRLDLTNDKMQFILEQAYNAMSSNASFNQLITCHGDLEHGYFFVIDADATVGQLKSLILECDFADLLSMITGETYGFEDSVQFKKLMGLILDQIPAYWDDDSIGSLYERDHWFAFDATLDKDYFRALMHRVVGDYSFWVGGHELVMEDVVNHIFDQMVFEKIYITLDVYIGDYRLYYVQNGDAVEGVFARPGTELSAIFDAVPPREGYDIVYFFNGEEISVAPDADVMDDTNPITYDYRVREHSLTLDVLFTDSVTGQEMTQSVDLSVAYGTVIDEAFLQAALADAGIAFDGYNVIFPDATVMPDSTLTLTVVGERIYFTVTWMVDGVLYDETLVAWGEIPVIDAPEKASDINFHYTFKDWGLVLVPIYADATYEAVFTPSSRYDDTVNDNATIGKDEDNNNITVDVGGVDGEGTPEITIPLGPIIEDLKEDPTQGLDYDHNFGDGYDLELDISPEAMQEIIRQLEEILKEMDATLEDVTIHTSREETTTENGDPAVKYEILIEVEGEPVDIRVEDGITVRVNVDDPADPEKEIVVYYKDPATGEMIELDSEVVGTDENGKLIIEFDIPGFGEIYVVEETKEYPVTGGTSTPEHGEVEISPENAAAGETVTVTVTPAEGYEVDKVIITDKDGNTFEATRDPDNENIFTYEQPSGGSTVEVIFKVAEYDVVFNYYNENGEAVSVTLTVTHGSLVTPPVAPAWMNESHSFTFAYWDCGDGMDYAELGGVFSDMTVEAVYNQAIRSFTVTFEYYDENEIWTKVEYTFEYGQTLTNDQIPAPQSFKTASHEYEYLDKWNADIETFIKADASYTAQYDILSLYNGGEDENNDEIKVEQKPGEDDVKIDVTDKGDGEVEIPMGPILDEAEKNPELTLDLSVDFGDGKTVDVVISADEMQNILDQLDKILEEKNRTYDDVDFYVSYEETDNEGKKAYVYGVTFRVDGEDVDIESLGTKGSNEITVTLPKLPDGYKHVVEYYDPDTGKYETLPEDMYTLTENEDGSVTAVVTTPWYTEIRFTEQILTFTVIFEYYDENGIWTKDECTFEYGQEAVAPQIPEKVVTLYTTYEFDGWNQALIPVMQDLAFCAQYIPSQNYTGANGETVEKNEDSLDITVDNGTDESEIPFSPILSEIKNGLNVPLNYKHIFADGYYLEVIFAETAEDHARLLAAIEAALAEAGLPLDSSITLYTARSVMTSEELSSVLTPEQIEALFGSDRINAVYKYEISFKVGDTVLSVNGLENNLHRVNVNYDPDSDSQFKVVTDQGEELDSDLTPGGDKGGEVDFSTPHYSSFFVVDYSEVYVANIGTTENITIVVNPADGVLGTLITVTATPAEDYHLVRLYYVFNGQEVTITNGQFTLPGDVEIKAELKKIHTVTFVGFDGSIIGTVRVIDGEAASAPDAPAVVGYSFVAWDTTFSNVTSDMTVTAIYEINQYTITFDSNDGSAVDSITADYGATVTKPADPTKTGYTFAGWYSDEALTEAYTFGTMPAEDITLYAKWTVNQYTIIFKDYDGTELKKETLDYGAAIVAPADPTRAPSFDTIYSFNGWNPEVAETVTGDATYTATYTESPRNNNEDVEIEQKPDGTIDVGGDAGDKDGDGKEEVEIPGGPVLDGMEDDLDQPINININFSDGHFLKAVILPEDQAEIMKQLKAILEAQGLTNDDVKIVVSREAVTLDGKSAYLYELGFKVGNVLVSLEGKGANTITVSAPVADGMDAGFEVYLKNMGGEYELITAECTAENGIASVSFSIKYYTAFRVKDVSTVVTQVPGVVETDTEAETEPSGCDGSNAWWIILLVVVLLVVLGLVGFVLYQKGILFKQIQKTMDESAEEENASGAPLFIPLGEELPEEELEEIHIVHEVSVEDVDKMMSDYTAEHILEESDKVGGLGKLGIINVGVLHNEFEDGDTVNLEILKEKDMIADSIGRLKVLASGSLDKALTVEADAFSVQAIKMITLTGGHAVKLRTNTEGAAQNQKKRKK